MNENNYNSFKYFINYTFILYFIFNKFMRNGMVKNESYDTI